MDEVMHLGKGGEDLIKSFERLELEPYYDSAGVLTEGWGHTARAGGHVPVEGHPITAEMAEKIFRRDIAIFEARVNRLVTVDLNQNQFDALVSFDFNTGELGASTLLKRLNKGDYGAVPSELMKWNKARVDGKLTVLKGLTRRRKAEVALWSTPSEDDMDHPDEEASAAQDVEPPQAKGMINSKIGNSAVALGGMSGMGLLSAISSDTIDGVNSSVRSATTLTETLTGSVKGLAHTFGPAAFVAMIVIAAAVWYWRYEHMQNDAK